MNYGTAYGRKPKVWKLGREAMALWLLDLQEQGDDGTGHCDYSPVLCGDCLISVGDCACPA